MKAVIDTSSLVSLVRYYLPFDKEGKLKAFIEERIETRKLIVLKQVVAECKLHGKDKWLRFCLGSIAGLLPPAEYQLERDKFTASADFAMVLYAYSIKEKEDVVIVTEETGYSNDGKPFRKIPGICDTIGVRTLNLPKFLSENSIIDLTVEVQKTSLF